MAHPQTTPDHPSSSNPKPRRRRTKRPNAAPPKPASFFEFRGFCIEDYNLAAFSMICMLLDAGFERPQAILQQAGRIGGRQQVLDVVRVLQKCTGWPFNVFVMKDDGTISINRR